MNFVEKHLRFLRFRTPLVALGIVALLSAGIQVGAAFLSESQLKATFLYNFASFVTWPQEEARKGQPFRYCVGQRGEVESSLEQLIRGEVIKGRPLVSHLLIDPAEADTCDILFLRMPLSSRSRRFLDRVEGKPVLTVADSADFVRQGGMIALVRRQRRVVIRINLSRVEQSGLEVSSLLLDLAEIVDQHRERP